MVKIISDSTCDLSPELIARYDIDIIPLHIILGEKDYLDGKGITPEDIYRWSDENKLSPKTAAVSMEDALAAFEPYAKEGGEIVVFTISSHMSSTWNVLRMAAEQVDAEHIHVIDSRTEEICCAFLEAEVDEPKLLYLWGHSYEFDFDDSWDRFENICKLISGHEDIFYGTNKEVFGL